MAAADQARGAVSELTFDTETTFKTTPTTPTTKILPFISESVVNKRELIDSQVITPTRNFKRPAQGNIDIGGDIQVEMNPYMGEFLKHLLGTVTTTGDGATTPYNHEMKVGSLPTSFVLEKRFRDKLTSPVFERFILYNGCRISSFTMTVTPDGIILGTFNIVGAKQSNSATSIDATPTDDGHIPWLASELLAADVKEGGSAIATVKNWTFTIDNLLDTDEYVLGGAGVRASLPEGKTQVTGTLLAMFDSMALFDKAVASTETSFQVTFKRGDATGIGAGNETMDIIIPELIYEEAGVGTPGPEGIEISLPFRAYFENSTEASSIEINLQNTNATV